MPTDMLSWFEPPASYAGDLGSYRSPLLFDDGTPVRSAEDWRKRREEIRQKWDQVNGSWPELLEKPAIDVLETEMRDGYVQKHVRVEIAPQQLTEGYLLIPVGEGKHPAVFVPGVDAETSIGLDKPMRDLALQLTKRGFVTLSIGAPGGNPRKPDIRDTQCQPLWFLAYVGANCANALAELPEVDANRIGVAGHAYGGKWAMFTSCLCDRYACAVWSEPGVIFDERRPGSNYWELWYLGAEAARARVPVRREEETRLRTGAYKTLVDKHFNLHELHALMAPRPFLVAAGSNRRPGWAASSADDESRWPALNHTIAVNRVLGYEHRVAMTNRPGHEPTALSNEQICRFLEYFLKSSIPVK